MITDVGEYIVGAYLQVIKKCTFVSYNLRAPDGGHEGLGELDVIGLDFENQIAYICEVTTHIRGTLYVSNAETVTRIGKKHERQKLYASKHLKAFPNHRFMFWSPVVPVGAITKGLSEIGGLELVINKTYTACVEEVREKARWMTEDLNNPFLRTLQILERLK